MFSTIFHVVITFLSVQHTMAVQNNYLEWQLDGNDRLDFTSQNYYRLDNNTKILVDGIYTSVCFKIENNSSEINKDVLFEDLDTLSQDDIVREQYELLPYPAVTTEEIEGLRRHYNGNNRHVPYFSNPYNELDVVNHFLFKGRNDFMNEFRMLVPGGGTKGGYFMSEQLNHTQNSEIVYIDFSMTSMSIAQLKIKIRKTSNVVWVISWLEAIPLHGIGIFDYIFCTGVLHHLKDPQTGLRIIKNVQPTKGGGGAIMVYGKYGRAGIYQIQHLLRTTNEKEATMTEQILNAKKILDSLPNNHWFAHRNSSDIQSMGDIGIYDLLLHKRDVAYSIKDLYEWVEKSSYYVIDFSLAELRIKLSSRLQFRDKALYQSIIKIRLFYQQWITELIHGNVEKQEIYVSGLKDAKASMKSSDHLVYSYGSPSGFRNIIEGSRHFQKVRGETFVFAILENRYENENALPSIEDPDNHIAEFAFPFTEFSRFFIIELTRIPTKSKYLPQMINKFTSMINSSLTYDLLNKEFEHLYPYLEDTGVFLIKHKSIGMFPKMCCRNRFRVLGIER